MPNWIVIEPKPWDGRYELVLPFEFTQREWGWAKRFAGYLPGTVDEGLDGYDPELIGVMALAALYRAGKIQETRRRRSVRTVQRLHARRHQTRRRTRRGDDAGPPPPSSNANGSSSGDGSPTSSETSPAEPTRSGSPSSATSESDPLTSVT